MENKQNFIISMRRFILWSRFFTYLILLLCCSILTFNADNNHLFHWHNFIDLLRWNKISWLDVKMKCTIDNYIWGYVRLSLIKIKFLDSCTVWNAIYKYFSWRNFYIKKVMLLLYQLSRKEMQWKCTQIANYETLHRIN